LERLIRHATRGQRLVGIGIAIKIEAVLAVEIADRRRGLDQQRRDARRGASDEALTENGQYAAHGFPSTIRWLMVSFSCWRRLQPKAVAIQVSRTWEPVQTLRGVPPATSVLVLPTKQRTTAVFPSTFTS